MGIYRCNKCKYISEHDKINIVITCAKCTEKVKVYDTPFFVKNIMSRWSVAVRELNVLKAQELDSEDSSEDNQTSDDYNLLNDVNLSETDILATGIQHQPLAQWFNKSNIKTDFDHATVDMSGYYDEAAQTIGSHYSLFNPIIGRICWSYRKQHNGFNIDLTKFSQKDGQTIMNICRTFYSNTLFARYSYSKKNKNIHINLQNAQPIKQFFNGGWLEWFALTNALSIAKNRGKNYTFSCARSANIRFANEDLRELDVVFLPNESQPLIIECKSGEYRTDLDKYLVLRKRLKLPAENFIILATDLDDTQAKSLSSMYELTFCSLASFAELLEKRL